MMAAQRLTVATRRVLLVSLTRPMERFYGSEVVCLECPVDGPIPKPSKEVSKS